MRLIRVTVTRPQPAGKDNWDKRRNAYVVDDDFSAGAQKAVEYYNEIDDADDYYVVGMDLVAGTQEGEGDLFIA